jgi:hypothetical protein
MYKNKKAWLRILEAFVAVALVLITLLILLGRQNSSNEIENEIGLLQINILSSISKDDSLRQEIMDYDITSGTSGIPSTEAYVSKVIPSWLDYRVQVCEPTNICALKNVDSSILANKAIYSQNTIIYATLTDNSPRQLKLFVWRK